MEGTVRRALDVLVAVLVWPARTRFGSLVAYELRRVRAAPSWLPRLHVAALVGFPLVFAVFAVVLVVDRSVYEQLLVEDGAVEWATVGALLGAAAIALGNARVAAAAGGRGRLVHLTLAAVCGLVVLEEISWGQRLFGIENPEFFVRYSDQKETNVHNVVQKLTHVAMKWPVGLGYVVYGALLPILAAAVRDGETARERVLARRLDAIAPLIPPLTVTRGLLLGGVLMLDLPSNQEEELAELFGTAAVVVMVLIERARLLEAGRRFMVPAVTIDTSMQPEEPA